MPPTTTSRTPSLGCLPRTRPRLTSWTSAEALRRLSCEDEAASDDLKGICAWGLLAGGQPVEKGEPLFPRLG